MNVLVVVSTGYIGATASEHLTATGHRVIALTRSAVAGLVETAWRSGGPHHAVDGYVHAPAMWRAEPLIDFTGSAWAVVDADRLVEAGRLVELRLAAVAEGADRMLTLGRYDEAVAVLEPVVVADPTRRVSSIRYRVCPAPPGTSGRAADDGAVQHGKAGQSS